MKFLNPRSALRFGSAFLAFVPFVIEVRATSTTDVCKTIKDIVCSADVFDSFCHALDQTGIDEKLDKLQSKLTVFAPSNSAFEDLLQDLNVNDIYHCPKETLTELLLVHIHEDDVIYRDELEDSCTNLLEMANGDKTRTICENNGNKIYQKGPGNSGDDIPRIVSFDIDSCNGVIHVVDRVILPSNFQEPQTHTPTLWATYDHTSYPVHKPTSYPIHKPTSPPTRKPTSRPTHKPTSYPVHTPTSYPVRKPTQNPTRKPTRSPAHKPTQSPTRKPTPPTRKPTSKPTEAVDSASCSAHPACAAAGLTGECCPANGDKKLDCCSNGDPTRRPTSKPTNDKTEGSCSAYPKCVAEGLTGECCPANGDKKLDCCSNEDPTRRPTSKPTHDKPEGSCSAYAKCNELGLEGDCCPTDDGKKLDCCFDKIPGTCSSYSGCVAEGLEGECCPAANGKNLDCCQEEEHGFPIINEEYCKYTTDFGCYKFGLPECCLKSSNVCPKEQPKCEVGFPIISESYCTYAPKYGCYENGWPECCNDNSIECPKDLSDCEIGFPVVEKSYCSKSPSNYRCYELGYPACCSSQDTECPDEVPSCNVGKRGCDLEDSLPSIYHFACSQPNFNILCYLIKKSEIDQLLDDTGTYTLFAPSNEAFEGLDNDKVDALLEDPTEGFQDLLKYHVSDSIYFEKDLSCEKKIYTLLGDNSDDFTTTTKCDSGEIFQKGNGNDVGAYPMIIATDIVTCNGVVHVVDKVILHND